MSGSPASPAARDLVGAWRLRRLTMRLADGSVAEPLGEAPAGQISYGRDGHMSAHLEQVGPGDPRVPTTAYSAYYGRFTVDAAAGTVTHHVDGASIPDFAGTDQLRRMKLESDTLILSTQTPSPIEIVWRRLGSAA